MFVRMPDEEIQERGREGVSMIKSWLEATTWMEFPFNSYEDGTRCTLALLTGTTKKLDLRGYRFGDKHQRRTMNVECKRYTTKGGQLKEFRRFLAIAYSAHAKRAQDVGQVEPEDFLWVTSNPFMTDGWTDLCSEENVLAAVQHEDNVDVIGDHTVDPKLTRTVSEGLWLLVFHERQIDVTLTAEEVQKVLHLLDRKGSTL